MHIYTPITQLPPNYILNVEECVCYTIFLLEMHSCIVQYLPKVCNCDTGTSNC